MATYYTVVGSQTATKVLSQTQSVKVEAVQLYTKPSSVYMVVNVPYTAWLAGNETTYLEPPVLLTEQLMGNDLGVPGEVTTYVNAARFVQDTDASHLLADYMEFTVYYQPDSGLGLPFTTEVRIPMTALASFAAFSQPISGGMSAQQLILAAHERLVKLAGL
jgi:hypothetical protein